MIPALVTSPVTKILKDMFVINRMIFSIIRMLCNLVQCLKAMHSAPGAKATVRRHASLKHEN